MLSLPRTIPASQAIAIRVRFTVRRDSGRICQSEAGSQGIQIGKTEDEKPRRLA
jgi:hypothetical protein